MKKITLLTLSFLLLFSVISYSQNSINVILDGSKISFDTPPLIDNGTTLVPLRAIFEALGASVEWNEKTQSVTANLDDTTIKLTINSKIAYKNNNRFDLLVSPRIINSRTFVPVRFIAESFGLDVEWDSLTSSVVINTEKISYDNYVLYSTDDLETLLINIANGYVIYKDGEYWATPEYASMLSNENIVYYQDVSNDDSFYDESPYDRYELTETEIEWEWISGYDFKKTLISEDNLKSIDTSIFEKSQIPGYFYVYAFTLKNGLTDSDFYLVPDMTDEFMNSENATGTFSGIRMKMENSELWFNYDDLVENNIAN